MNNGSQKKLKQSSETCSDVSWDEFLMEKVGNFSKYVSKNILSKDAENEKLQEFVRLLIESDVVTIKLFIKTEVVAYKLMLDEYIRVFRKTYECEDVELSDEVVNTLQRYIKCFICCVEAR